jgi:hypothetical protein
MVDRPPTRMPWLKVAETGRVFGGRRGIGRLRNLIVRSIGPAEDSPHDSGGAV